MERKSGSKLNTQIYEQACTWFIESRAGDLDEPERREFDLWIRKSPEHLGAYLEVAAIWSDGPDLDPQRRWSREGLVEQAALEPDNVVVFPAPTPTAAPVARTSKYIPRAALAACAALACLSVALLGWFNRDSTYLTEAGEQRSIALGDGSTVELNSRSALRVHYTNQSRTVELLKGQALFSVARDPARPFVVISDDTRVRALGTQFDIYKKNVGTVVTVVEGKVEVSSPTKAGMAVEQDVKESAPSTPPPPHSLRLAAGEQLTVTPRAVYKTQHPNVVGVTAWTRRELVFESASISELVEEFNRYNERQLTVEHPEHFDFHISGIFSTTDPASLVRFLRARPGIEVIETPAEIRIRRNNR